MKSAQWTSGRIDTEAIAQIRQMAASGEIHARDVIRAAEKKKNPLHRYFEWDDTKAGFAYRLVQARGILRSIHIIPHETQETRVLVSLESDREVGGGVYREISRVLQDQDQKSELLAQALGELKSFQRKYSAIKELAGVLGEIGRALV